MALSSTSVNQSFATCSGAGNNLVSGTRFAKCVVRIGSASIPADADTNKSYVDGSFLTRGVAVTIAWALRAGKNAGVGNDATQNIGAGLFIFEDDADGGGIGTGAIQYIDISPQTTYTFTNAGGAYTLLASGTTTFTPAKSGSFKVVVVLYSLSGLTVNAANPPTTARVRNTVAVETDFYIDSDGNTAFSNGAADDPALKVIDENGGTNDPTDSTTLHRSGWGRVAFDEQTLSSSQASPLRYTKSPTITLDACAATFYGASAKQMRVGFVPTANANPALWTDPGAATAPAKTQNLSMPTSGASVTSGAGTNNIDTDFNATDKLHRLRSFVGPAGGQSSTPTAEKPAILSRGGTINVVDTNDQAWTVADASGLGAGLSRISAYCVENTTNFTIGSGLQLTAQTFREAARTNLQDLYRRSQPTAPTDGTPQNARVFLRSTVKDSGGVNLPNATSLITSVRTQNASPVVDTTLAASTAIASGILDQTINVGAAWGAFNRFIKTGASRVSGSHLTTGPDDPASPPATFNAPGANAQYVGPFPAYPKTIRITGNAYAGVKEPTVDAASIFGVNSEIIFEGLWSGSLTAAALDANGVPTGAGTREQTLGAGSLKIKLTTATDSGTNRVVNISEANAKDVAGIPITVTTDNLFTQRALFDDTNNAVTDAGTDLSNQQDLTNSLGYQSGNNSLDTIAPPTDPNASVYGQGAADTVGQHSTFALTVSGSTPIFGFTGDAGNFGYKTTNVAFIAADLSITLNLTPNVVQSSPGITRRVAISVTRITTDDDDPYVPPDSTPVVFMYGMNNATGATTRLGKATVTPVSGDTTGALFYCDIVIPSGYSAIKLKGFAKVNGSRTPGGDGTQIQIGYIPYLAVPKIIGYK